MAKVPTTINETPRPITLADQETALFKFIKRTFENSPYKYSSKFKTDEPYCVTSDDVREIVSRVASKFENLCPQSVEFSYVIRTYSATEKKYADIESLLDRAGNLERISSIEIRASTFTLLENGDAIAGKILIGLSERDDDFSGFDSNSDMTFEIEGSEELWVRDSDQEFRVFLKRFELSKVEKGLRKFVHDFKPHIILSLSLSVLSYLSVMRYFQIGALMNRTREKNIAEEDILSHSNTLEMLRAYIDLQLNPIGSSFWWTMLAIALVIPAVYLVYFLSKWFGRGLKAIVPNPIIAVGDSGAIALRDREGWKKLAALLVLPIIIGLTLSTLFFILDILSA